VNFTGLAMPFDDIDLAPDLTLTVGAEATRLTPGSAFRLAERLIRISTRRLIELECERAGEQPVGKRSQGAR
jgi:hypothetical protein